MSSAIKSKNIKPRKGEMIKPNEIIGVGSIESWSLLDRRIFNTLLKNAWGDRLEDPTAVFEIPIRKLRGDHKGNERIKESLEKLQKTLVTAKMPDGKTRTVQILGGNDISNDDREIGVLRYEFSKMLIPLLRNSELYTRLETKVLSSFASKYSLALYELIASKINLHKTNEIVDIDVLRTWLGVDNTKLKEWAEFRRNAIEPAIKEVNSLSPFNVKIEPISKGRKIIKAKVSWSKKEPFSPVEQDAVHEVNRHKSGRKARVNGTVETIVKPIRLTEDQILKGYNVAAKIERIDKHQAYADWQNQVASLPIKPDNLEAHWIDFCKKRANELR